MCAADVVSGAATRGTASEVAAASRGTELAVATRGTEAAAAAALITVTSVATAEATGTAAETLKRTTAPGGTTVAVETTVTVVEEASEHQDQEA